jgi:ribosome biogenesis SPOUT family RNA methylase Rps3
MTTVRRTARAPHRRFGPEQQARHDGHDKHQEDGEYDASLIHGGVLGDRVVSTRMKRVTTEDSFQTQPTTAQRAIALDRIVGIAGAGGGEATLREHQM